MPGQPLAIQLTVDADGLVSGLKVAGKSVDGAAQQIRASFRDIKVAEEETTEAGRGLLEHVRSMRQEMFIGSFMARQITEIGAASKETAGMVAGLAGAFLVGNWTGLAIEGALKIASAFNESGGEIEKFSADAGTAVQKLREKVDQLLESMRHVTESEKLQHQEIGPLLRQEADLKQQVLTANLKLADAEDKLKASLLDENQAASARAAAAKAAAESELEDAQKKLETTQEQIRADNETIKPLSTAEQIAAAQKKRAEEDRQAWRLYGEQLRLTDALEQDIYQRTLKRLKDETALAVAQDKAEGQSNVALLNLQLEQGKQAEAQGKSQIEESKRLAKERVKSELDAAKSIGDAFGTAFEGIASGTMTLQAAFKNLAKEAVKATIDAAIKQVEAEAAVAAAKAAAANADIPIIGPALAVGALAAMEGLVLGLISSIPGAAVGADIPIGVNPIMKLHGGESVITAKTTDRLQEALDSGGIGGAHIHIHAMDGASVQRVVEGPAFARALREARRNGAIP